MAQIRIRRDPHDRAKAANEMVDIVPEVSRDFLHVDGGGVVCPHVFKCTRHNGISREREFLLVGEHRQKSCNQGVQELLVLLVAPTRGVGHLPKESGRFDEVGGIRATLDEQTVQELDHTRQRGALPNGIDERMFRNDGRGGRKVDVDVVDRIVGIGHKFLVVVVRKQVNVVRKKRCARAGLIHHVAVSAFDIVQTLNVDGLLAEPSEGYFSLAGLLDE